jgi:hypothetical protein
LSWCPNDRQRTLQFVHSHEFHLPSTMKSAKFVFVITNFLITLPYMLVVLKVLLNRRNTWGKLNLALKIVWVLVGIIKTNIYKEVKFCCGYLDDHQMNCTVLHCVFLYSIIIWKAKVVIHFKFPSSLFKRLILFLCKKTKWVFFINRIKKFGLGHQTMIEKTCRL